MSKVVQGFSKLNKVQKIDWLVTNFFDDDVKTKQVLSQYWNDNKEDLLEVLGLSVSDNDVGNSNSSVTVSNVPFVRGVGRAISNVPPSMGDHGVAVGGEADHTGEIFAE